MTARMLLILAALALAACAAAPKPPDPDRPDCAQPTQKPPLDGGIGGTGRGEAECDE